MALTLKILITLMFLWQIVKPALSLTGVMTADAIREKSKRPITKEQSTRLDNIATGAFVRLIWWIVWSTLMIIGIWVWL